MPSRLPIFPLDAVLFPGTPMPLHIFEPRYRRMLVDCLAADERFGLVPPGRAAEAPPPGAVGCVARVRATHELPDGRSNIVVVGETRFLIRRYVDEGTPYLIAMVDEFSDRPGPDVPGDALEELRRSFLSYVESLRVITDAPEDDMRWAEDPEALTFQIGATADLDPTAKRRLLELRTASERVELLRELLPPLVEEAGARARVHARARGNGKGGSRPDIAPAT
jgi:ATP-dependent Lon protease